MSQTIERIQGVLRAEAEDGPAATSGPAARDDAEVTALPAQDAVTPPLLAATTRNA